MSDANLKSFHGIARLALSVLILVWLSLIPARATIINVPADQATIQDGINVAGAGDTVLVAPGYYLENISFQGKEIVVSSHFLLNSDPAFIFTTTIDGSNPANADSASTVRIFCTSIEAPVFQGFTVTGGRGTYMLDPTEGAVYRNGGGIATSRGRPVIRFNYIHHNQPAGYADYGGGGIYLQLGEPIVENNIIMYNPGKYGCGLCLRSANAIARNNVIAFNSGGVEWGGAGVYLYGGHLDGYNNTIAFNHSTQPAGGIRVAAASVNMRNSIVWGNTSLLGNPHTHVDEAYGGTIDLQYSDIQGGYAGTGNIDADPVFSRPWCFTSEGSPCIDAGDPDVAVNDLAWPSTPTSARWPSRGGLRNDMGAWGGPACYPPQLAPVHADGTVGWVPWEVTFEAESYFEADSWLWEFGDGDGAAGQAVVHTYDQPGVYDVTLTVGHDGGQSYEQICEGLVYVLADTLWVDSIALSDPGPVNPVEVVVYARNAVPLDLITVPVQYAGDLGLAYDHFSVVGCRTEQFDRLEQIYHDPVSRVLLFELEADTGVAATRMPAGSGPILKLTFYPTSVEPGSAAGIELTVVSPALEPQFVFDDTGYRPAVVDGAVTYFTCCVGRVGDANGLGGDEPTIGDVSVMIDAKFITGTCDGILDCLDEADVNQSAGGDPDCGDVTIGDISTLIDYLFITGPALGLADCL